MEATGTGARASARVVLCTAPDAEIARRLARTMVERRLAACVNVLDGATSIYRWQGAVEEAREALMVIKTSAARVADLERVLVELHPYDTPEFVVLAAEHVERRYLDWLLEQAS